MKKTNTLTFSEELLKQLGYIDFLNKKQTSQNTLGIRFSDETQKALEKYKNLNFTQMLAADLRGLKVNKPIEPEKEMKPLDPNLRMFEAW